MLHKLSNETKPLMKIEGFALPFDQENNFNETLSATALDEFLERQGDKPLPMGFMHDWEIGYWTKLEKRDGGLYVEGYVTDRGTADFIREDIKGKGELSITFEAFNPPRTTASKSRAADWMETIGSVPRNLQTVEHLYVKEAGLLEISLVDSGAFSGTWFKAVDI